MKIDQMIEAGGHPRTWDMFVGQDRAKMQLKLKAAAARKRNATMGHTLLYSPEPGIGKTSLALLAAQEMGRTVLTVNNKLSFHEFRYHLLDLADGDVIVWDEAQQQFPKGVAGRKQWEWMLNYMQHGILTNDKGMVVSVPRVTLIMASTDFGLFPQTILDRVESVIELQPYDFDQQVRIACGMAGRLLADLPMPDVATARAVASAANGKPRIMDRILRHLADQAAADAITPYDNGDGTFTYDMSMALDWEGVTLDGLSAMAQKYMLFLLEDCHNEPVGLDRIVEHLREDRKAVSEVERILMSKGYVEAIQRGKSGRNLSEDGLQRTRELRDEMREAEGVSI